MSLPPLAPLSALEARLGAVLSGMNKARAEAALEDASALVRLEAGRDWVAADEVTITAPDTAVVVTLTAALRAYRHPEGYVQESLGDYSARLSESGGTPTIYLTKDELRMIRAAARRSGVTVRTPSAYHDPRYAL